MTIRLFLLNPDTIFAALVDQASFTYPIAQCEFDTVGTGAYGDIEVGMTVLFGTSAGADDLGRQRIRKAADADTIFFGRSSLGVRDGEVKLADNVHITVLDDYRVWSKMPYIATDGTIYKDHDITVGTKTGDDIPPVANAGVGFAATIDSGTDVITASWNAITRSFAVADGATVTGYAWDVGDGTITVGTSSDYEITATFPAGFRWVKLTVTDDNANTHTCRMPVYARDPASDTTISSFNIVSHRITQQGQTISLSIREAIAETSYPDGTLALVWEDEPSSAADRSHMLFIGWHQNNPEEIRSQRTGILQDTTMTFLDVAGKLDTLPGFPQEVERVASPSTWTEMKAPHMDKYLHYLLHWHSTALELADWTDSGTGNNFPFIILGSDGESLFNQVDRRARALVPDRIFTCNRLGQMANIIDPMLQDTGDRTATIQDTLAISDWQAIRYTHQKPPTIHWLQGNAIQARIDIIAAFFCMAPGETPGQGETEQEHGEQLAISQADLNACEGHRYARINAEESTYSITLSDSDDRSIEPANMTWVRLTITDAVAAKRGLAFAEERGLPIEMNISYQSSREGLVKTIELMWERETDGTPAVTYIPPDTTFDSYEDNWTWGPQVYDWNNYFPQDLQAELATMVLSAEDGYLYQTATFTSASPTYVQWQPTSPAMHGTYGVGAFKVNAYSPGYIGTGTAINGWVSNSGELYYVTDMLAAAPTYPIQLSASHKTLMDFSFGVEGWGVVLRYNVSVGMFARYTTDGVTWSAEKTISAITDGLASGAQGLYVSSKTPGLAYTFAWPNPHPAYNPSVLFVTTDYGETWAVDTAFTVDPGWYLGPGLHFPWADNDDETICFYGKRDASTTEYNLMKSVVGSAAVAVGPTNYGPYYSGPVFQTSVQDPNYMVLCGYDGPAAKHGVFTSTNGGSTWTQIVADADAPVYKYCAISGNDRNTLYLWGGTGQVGYSSDFGATIEDKSGNLTALSATEIVGIAGGPS